MKKTVTVDSEKVIVCPKNCPASDPIVGCLHDPEPECDRSEYQGDFPLCPYYRDSIEQQYKVSLFDLEPNEQLAIVEKESELPIDPHEEIMRKKLFGDAREDAGSYRRGQQDMLKAGWVKKKRCLTEGKCCINGD